MTVWWFGLTIKKKFFVNNFIFRTVLNLKNNLEDSTESSHIYLFTQFALILTSYICMVHLL